MSNYALSTDNVPVEYFERMQFLFFEERFQIDGHVKDVLYHSYTIRLHRNPEQQHLWIEDFVHDLVDQSADLAEMSRANTSSSMSLFSMDRSLESSHGALAGFRTGSEVTIVVCIFMK